MVFGSRAALAARKPIFLPNLPRGKFFADAAPTIADVLTKVGEINGALAAFRAKHEQEIAEVKAGRSDVVTKTELEKINADVTRLGTELQDMNSKLAAARALGTEPAKAGQSPEHVAYNAAFNKFVRRGVENGLADLAIKAALSTDSNPDGGYVVPVELDKTLLRVMGTMNAMRQIATVTPVGTDTLTVLHNLGGASCGWVAEKAARPVTNTPTLARLEYKSNELYANPKSTQQLLDDAYFDIEAWLAEEIGIAFSETEGTAFINGSGVGQPFGLVTGYTMAASTIASPSAWGKIGYTGTGQSGDFVASSSSANGIDCLIDLRASLKPGYLANARWLMNRASAAKCRKLKDADGNYVWRDLTAPFPEGSSDLATLLGHPVSIDDNMPDFAANAFPIAFGDFARGYKIVDRMGSRLLRDPYTDKPNVGFYVTKRVGGGVRDFNAIKVLKAA